MRRPSAALIISCVALVGAWGGPAVAAKLITSKDVKDRSLRGKDLRSNTVTGRVVANLSGRDLLPDSIDGTDVLESSLGQVPRAREALSASEAGHAATAARAVTAGSLEGARIGRVNFARAADSEGQVLDLGGLRLRARCNGSGSMTVFATTTAGPGWIRFTGTSRRSGADQADPLLTEDDDFRAGREVNVFPAGADDVAGQLVYLAPDGATVTATLLAESGVDASRGYACLLAGTAVLVDG